MDENTQKEQLKSWVEQRDSILSEISALRTERDNLSKSNKELSESYTKINNDMHVVLGRIEELKDREKELPTLIPREIASLQENKSSLETQIVELAKLVSILTIQKESLEKDITLALSTFDTVKKETGSLDKIIDHVTVVSKENKRIVDELVVDLKNNLKTLFDVNQKNVTETNLVLEKLPKMLVELQKTKLIRNKI
jgi:chromosome segregation ATPase